MHSTQSSSKLKSEHIDLRLHTLQCEAIGTVWHTALVADGLASALFFIEPHVLQEEFQFECAHIGRDMSLTYSDHFPATFFTSEIT